MKFFLGNVKKYIKVWWIMTSFASQVAFSSKFGAAIFIIGKILRFGFFLIFLFLLSMKTKSIEGYTLWQMVFFFMTFNLIDTLAQFFFREVYRFRYHVISGNFDYILTKPLSSLFRSLFGGSDILDLALLFLSIFFIIFSLDKIGSISPVNIVLYVLLLFNAFVIAASFHIFVLAVGVLTTAVDNTIMLYRDLTQMGRVPIDIYQEPLRGLITFVIPVGIMMTFPAKALAGILSIESILISFLVGILFFLISLKFWYFSLKFYASASS